MTKTVLKCDVTTLGDRLKIHFSNMKITKKHAKILETPSNNFQMQRARTLRDPRQYNITWDHTWVKGLKRTLFQTLKTTIDVTYIRVINSLVYTTTPTLPHRSYTTLTKVKPHVRKKKISQLNKVPLTLMPWIWPIGRERNSKQHVSCQQHIA